MAEAEEANGGPHEMLREASADAGPSKPPPARSSGEDVRASLDVPVEISPRASLDTDARANQLEQELQQVRQEKDVLSTQYRSLLGKLTAMRTSLGEKLKEDAVSDAHNALRQCSQPVGRAGSKGNGHK